MTAERRQKMEQLIELALSATSNSDLDIAIQEVAEYTGYSHDFLVDRITESFQDGFEYDEAVENTIITACELDY